MSAAEKVRQAVADIAATPMQMSLVQWQEVSSVLLAAADELERLHDDYYTLRDSFTAIDSIVRAPDTLNAIFAHPRTDK